MQLEHDQLTPCGPMVHDHHPAAPAPPYQAHGIDWAPGGLLPGVATVWDGLVAIVVGNGMMIVSRCQLGVQNSRRHVMASAQAICPSKSSVLALSR